MFAARSLLIEPRRSGTSCRRDEEEASRIPGLFFHGAEGAVIRGVGAEHEPRARRTEVARGSGRRRSVNVSWVNWLTGKKASFQDGAFFL